LRKLRILSLVIATSAVLAVPAAGSAKALRATVLSLDRMHHRLRVVTPKHAVRSFRYTAHARLRTGDAVSVQVRGGTARTVRRLGHARTVRFYGRVANAGPTGALLRLGDGRTYRIGRAARGHRLHSAQAGAVTVTLQPGETVLVTLTLGSGQSVTISIHAVEAPAGSDPVDNGDSADTTDDNNGNDYTVDGTVSAVDPVNGTLSVTTSQGPMTFSADPDLLDAVAVGDAVTLYYSRDTQTGELTADDLTDLTADATGDSADPSGARGDQSGQPGDQSGQSGSPSGDGSGDGQPAWPVPIRHPGGD
jgi:hypothetical protein